MTEQYRPPYDLLHHKKETEDPELARAGLVRIEQHPKIDNLQLLIQLALKYGCRVVIDDTQPESVTEQGRILLQVVPLPGRELPDWDRFWAEWKQLLGKA